MTPGRTLLALVAVAAGVAIGVPLLSSNLHKLAAQGRFHSGATKGGLIQPATPTPQTTPVTGLLQPGPTPTPAHRTHPGRTPRRAPATPCAGALATRARRATPRPDLSTRSSTAPADSADRVACPGSES